VARDRCVAREIAIGDRARRIQGHDIREVATLLDVPDGTVKSRLFLARQQLKERLSWMNR
jgi:RNA polymerase sigma-70 factor (ECF subfamily)